MRRSSKQQAAIAIPAGPESLGDSFRKGALLGQKWQYQAKFAKIVPEHLKVCHI